MKRLRLLLGLAAALTLAGCASTDADIGADTSTRSNDELVAIDVDAEALVDGTSPEAILELVQGHGFAELKVDSDGDPLIAARFNDTQYFIFFYGCEAGQSCREVQFGAGWRGTGMSMERVNAWNQETRFGKAYIDSIGDPVLEFTVNLYKGVSRANLNGTIEWWMLALTAFEEGF